MAQPRHKAARHRAENPTRQRLRRSVVTVGVPVSIGVTATAVTLGVVSAGASSLPVAGTLAGTVPGPTTDLSDAASGPVAAAPDLSRRTSVSRSESRLDKRLNTTRARPLTADEPPTRVERLLSPALTRAAILGADTRLFTTTELNLWDGPGKHSAQVAELDTGRKVLVTGRTLLGREEVVVGGRSRWVTAGYLTDQEPVRAAAGLSMDPCPNPSVENGLTDGAVYVYRSVCHAFPQITSYGGYDNHGEHASGKAIDIMTSDTELGTAIRDFLVAHAAELNLYDVIWQQHIFTQERASEGFRYMPDRGSTTANHYDHVHVSVY